MIAVHPSLGVETLRELVAVARREPGLRYGLGGAVSGEQHILVAGSLILQALRLNLFRTEAADLRLTTCSRVTLRSLASA